MYAPRLFCGLVHKTSLLSNNSAKIIWGAKQSNGVQEQFVRYSHAPAENSERAKKVDPIHTKDNQASAVMPKFKPGSIIMGRVSHDRHDKVVKIGVPKHRLNEYYLLYVRENDDVLAYDELDQCNPGDWVLLRPMKDSIDTNVAYKVEKVIYSYGKYIDPLTGRRSLGIYYDDDMKKLEEIKIEL